jgi:hypothetical protein
MSKRCSSPNGVMFGAVGGKSFVEKQVLPVIRRKRPAHEAMRDQLVRIDRRLEIRRRDRPQCDERAHGCKQARPLFGFSVAAMAQSSAFYRAVVPVACMTGLHRAISVCTNFNALSGFESLMGSAPSPISSF